MNVSVVFCHPTHGSLIGAAHQRVLAGLRSAGHTVRVLDLYSDGFIPELSAFERSLQSIDHRKQPEQRQHLEPHFDFLQSCDTLVLVYPTWWGAQPGMLKGWFDRVWSRGVVYDRIPSTNRIVGLLHNVRRIVVVTTHGSTKLINSVQGEPGKRTINRSIRDCCHPRCRTNWISFYGTDTSSIDQRERFLDHVERRMSRLPAPRSTR